MLTIDDLNRLERVLVERDGVTPDEARSQCDDAKERVLEGEDPEEILRNEFGLEPDYIVDILPDYSF